MNLLEFFFIISWVILLILSIDIAKRQKFNALHFIVFIWIWFWLLIFTFFPQILNLIGSVFWIQRWADVLVYASIIFLLYFVILLLNKVEKNREDMTILIREIAIKNSNQKEIQGEICFIIAAYNEEKVIWNTLEQIFNAWYQNILVINDGSKDTTLYELEKYLGKIIILNHYKNRGQGAALETWFEYIRRYGKVKYICTFDADWQHQISDVKKFLQAFREDESLDIVLWSRFIKKTNTNISFWRKIILKLWILFTFFISNIKLTDSHNGYRIIKTTTLKNIHITLDWMWHASEIIDIIASKKLKYKEIPVDILYTEYSKAKWQKWINALNIALKTIWYKFFK